MNIEIDIRIGQSRRNPTCKDMQDAIDSLERVNRGEGTPADHEAVIGIVSILEGIKRRLAGY